jgi:hypothetical protein
MSIAGSIDAPIDLFGGLVADMAPADLPLGVSPDCQDVAFLPGGVKTRPGIAPAFAAISGNPTVNYLKSYIPPSQQLRLLALDSAGALWKESSPGALTQIASGLAASAIARSITLFGREYIAISDGKSGADLPRQFDDTNFDRVSQVGPGAGPTSVADAIANISSIARASNVVSVATATPHNLLAGDQVVVENVTDTSFNGTFPVATIPDATHFTYAQTAADATSSGGTACPLGNIAPGAHQVAVIFVTRQGYLTRPSPAVTWTAAGNRRVALDGIPTGPANVVARILAFTGAGGASFYYTGTGLLALAGGTLAASNLILADNTTTQAVVDFSEATLLSGTLVDGLFKLVELGESAGVIDYAQRLFWWGERNKANNWLNLTFDGGWDAATSSVPLGWTADATFGAGGSREVAAVASGEAYRITGDGVAATCGLITQPAVVDEFGVARIAPNTAYSVRARVRDGGGLAQGSLHVQLSSASNPLATAGLEVTAAQAGAAFAEFTAQITTALATVPADLELRIFADGTPTNAGYFIVDNIEIFPTAQPVNGSLVRASRTEDPESYDGVNGILSVAENNGQTIRAAFRLRERLYFVKERSLHVTEDDGVNEPSLWSVSEVSRAVGTPSVNGVDTGEDWAIIADRNGLYLFSGAEPVKISQEIQPLWDQINWSAGHTLWVRVDQRNQRILVGAPFGTATSPNKILVLDYRGLASADEIASVAPVHFSTFTGKLFAVGKARKWSPWTIAANSCALVERSDGTAQLFFGSGVPTGAGSGNGKIYQLSDAQLSDDGAAIASYYTTYFVPGLDMEQALQLGAHRKLFTYLTAYVEGAGTLDLTAYIESTGLSVAQQPWALSNPATQDLELPINLLGERVAFRVGTSAPGAWFRLQKFVPVLRPDPWAPVRGVN